MKINMITLIAFTLTLAGCSNQDYEQFVKFMVILVGGPYISFSVIGWACNKWSKSFIRKIFQDEDGDIRLLLVFLIIMAWFFFLDEVT